MIVGITISLTDMETGQTIGIPGLIVLFISIPFVVVAYVVRLIKWAIDRRAAL